MDEKNEKKSHEESTETVEQATDTPRKILLGKRVVRQFEVRSGLQTGSVRTTLRTC